jgi:soluble lytic murein transglycosylase-like protein
MRALAVIGAVLASAVITHASNWDETPGQYFARDRGQAVSPSPYGAMPRAISRDKSGNRARNAAIIAAAAQREGVPVALAHKLTNRESGFNHLARSPVGAMGLTQVMPGTWRAEGCHGSPWRPEDNAACGMRYFAKFYRQGGAHYAALRYHGGPNTRMHGVKTRAYAAAVAGPSAPPRWAGTLPIRVAMWGGQ